jgi:FixJ family two-component response regulator
MELNLSLVSVVDDDESVRESRPDLLRCFGFNADAFHPPKRFSLRMPSAKQAVCSSISRCPGCRVPTCNGELKRRRVTIPIVFITGDGDRTVTPRASRASRRRVPAQTV